MNKLVDNGPGQFVGSYAIHCVLNHPLSPVIQLGIRHTKKKDLFTRWSNNGVQESTLQPNLAILETPTAWGVPSRLKGRVCRSIGTCHQLAVCCSVLQCVAVCCSVLTCHQFAVCCSVLQCVAVCCSVLQCVWMSPICSVLQCVAVHCSALQCVSVCCSVLQCVAVCWRVVATCCRVLQRVAECCSVSCAVTNSITNSFSPLHTSHGACDGCFLVHACALVPYHDLGLLQCVAVCCSVLQCVAVRCSAL